MFKYIYPLITLLILAVTAALGGRALIPKGATVAALGVIMATLIMFQKRNTDNGGLYT